MSHLYDARGVKQDHLVVRLRQDAQQLVPGCLGFARHNGQLLTQHGIQQRALAGIGPPYESNISYAACTRSFSLLTSNHCCNGSSKMPR